MRQVSVVFSRLLVLFCCAVPAFATIRVVPLVYPTIQSGIDASSDGDTVLVSPGTYYENIDFKGKAITVTSTLSTDLTAIALATSSTFIDGGSKAPAVTLTSSSIGSTLSYFTVQHGGSTTAGGPSSNYGGVSITGQGAIVLGNIITSNNFGGVLALDVAAQITSNTIQQNTCWGIVSAGSTITGNEVSGTQTPATGCTISNSQGSFTTNSSGMLLLPAQGVPNRAGTATTTAPGSTVLNNTVESNVQVVASGAPADGGAGILIVGGSHLIQNNTIRNNSAPGARGGAIDVVGATDSVIFQNLIYGNHAGCGGAAIAFHADGIAGDEISDITIFHFQTYGLTVANNTIANNVNDANSGCPAAAQIEPGPNGASTTNVMFVNNIITGDGNQPAIACQKSGSSLFTQATFDHNLLYNAGSAFFDGTCVDESTNVALGNVVADPKFVNASGGNYQLAAGSPAIDRGNNSFFQSATIELMTTTIFVRTLDFAGNARVQNATGKLDGTGQEEDVIDMGAYEATGKTASTSVVGVLMQPTGYPTDVGNGVVTAFVNNNLGISPFFPPEPSTTCCVILSDVSTGTLSFFMDGLPIGVPTKVNNAPWAEQGHSYYPMASGLTTIPTYFTPGTHVLTASFQPSTGVTTATSIGVVINISQEATHLLLEADPLNSTVGTPVTFTVYGGAVYGSFIPTPVTLINVNTGKTIATINLDPTTGVGTFTTSSLSPGPNVFQASFAGSGIYESSLSNEVGVFQTSPTSLSLSSSINPAYALVPFTLTAQMTPIPTFSVPEYVYFYAPAASGVLQRIGIGTIDAAGTATASVSLPAGTYNITAVYNGDEYYGQSTSPVLVEVVLGSGTSVSVSSGLNPAKAFQAISLSAHVSASSTAAAGSITGTVSFVANGTTVGSGAVDQNGDATTSVALPAGTYSILASYGGDASFSPSKSTAISEIVNVDSTVTTLTASPNPGYTPNESETLTAVVAAVSSKTVPTGSITFYDTFNNVTTTLQSVSVSASGQIVLTTSALAPGVHVLTASYGGDANFQGSASAPVSLTILLRDFVLSTPASITLQTEHHISLPVTLTATGGFTDQVIISCSNLPAWATCNFPHGTTVSLAGNETAGTDIDIDTDAILNFASIGDDRSSKDWRGGAAFALLLPFLLLPLHRRVRGRSARLLVAFFALAMVTVFTGCSGLYPHHTTPGTYPITLTGTGATTGRVHTTTFNLIVTP